MKRTVPLPDDFDLLDEHLLAPDEIETAESIEIVREALSAMDEPFRRTITMLYVDGLARIEVARREGVTPQSISYRQSRGIEILRRALGRKGRPVRPVRPVDRTVFVQGSEVGG